MFAGFPVPLAANLVKADQENRYEEYKWWAASETDSITPYYWLVIRIWGWQEKEREGKRRSIDYLRKRWYRSISFIF